MRKLILMPGGLLVVLILVGYLALNRTAPPEAAAGVARLAAATAPESDLPPAGTRSLFDHLIKEHGSLPYPFDRLIEMLTAYSADGTPPQTLLIPDGRSLLKGQADAAHPRIVLAADMQPPAGASLAPMFKGRLFLGFVDQADEIEVLSYNSAAGRFEFQLVENYCAGCVPRIVYAQRAICLSCHSGGGPIFPVRPWQETNAQPAVSAQIAAHHASSYFSVPVERRLENAEAFDNLTDIGNVIPTTQRIWQQGCGDIECRRLMLRLALRYAVNPAALDPQGMEATELRTLQRRHWPTEGIVLANSDLPNRDPADESVYQQTLWQQLQGLFVSAPERILTGDKLKDFDSLPALPSRLDPLSPREPQRRIQASDLDGVYGLAQLFSAADIAELEALSAYSSVALAAAADRLERAVLDGVADRSLLVPALRQALGAAARPYCCRDVSGMSEPVTQGEPPLELPEDSPLQVFERYCFACHRGNPAAKLNFMAGASADAVAQQIRDTDSIREVLDYPRYLGSRKESSLMPPADSWQRAELERALARGENPLAQMREQVPSLFEF